MKNTTDNGRDIARGAVARQKGEASVSAIDSAPSVHFSMVARAITRAGKRIGLHVPGFRSPPQSGQLDRTVRRHKSGSIVAVRVKGRPFAAVIGDLVEGVVVCNQLTQREAGDVRNVLWHAAIQVGQNDDSTSTRRPTVLIHHSDLGETTAAA